jgi:hypothetical protein
MPELPLLSHMSMSHASRAVQRRRHSRQLRRRRSGARAHSQPIHSNVLLFLAPAQCPLYQLIYSKPVIRLHKVYTVRIPLYSTPRSGSGACMSHVTRVHCALSTEHGCLLTYTEGEGRERRMRRRSLDRGGTAADGTNHKQTNTNTNTRTTHARPTTHPLTQTNIDSRWLGARGSGSPTMASALDLCTAS